MKVSRGKWQGMWTIVQFNWPFYGLALICLATGLLGLISGQNLWIRLAGAGATAGAAYFLGGSLGVSHWVYDRSDLYQWRWLKRALSGCDPRHFVFCHSGFDETSDALKLRLGGTWETLDHYDSRLMTEASIRRARKKYPPTRGTRQTPYHQWSLAEGSVDVVFGILAIHELRSEVERTAWFREAKRCLRAGGRILLVEHTRDLANFVAFGPGFLHFHSVASWTRCWKNTGLQCRDHFTITPWVRVFVLEKP
jgi:SAM-dependent methyltransferase